MTGRRLMRAIASITFWSKAFPLVLTPMIAVGLSDSTTAALGRAAGTSSPVLGG